jgi:hypothetical protein
VSQGEKKVNQASVPSSEPICASREEQFEAQKKIVEELKAEWKLLWSERFDDKIKAEGVSVANYTSLRVEKGLVIHATRDFKALNFREILEERKVENADRFVQPDVNVGGWNKFIKTKITNQQPRRVGKRAASYVAEKPVGQRPKKSGRGWVHSF